MKNKKTCGLIVDLDTIKEFAEKVRDGNMSLNEVEIKIKKGYLFKFNPNSKSRFEYKKRSINVISCMKEIIKYSTHFYEYVPKELQSNVFNYAWQHSRKDYDGIRILLISLVEDFEPIKLFEYFKSEQLLRTSGLTD